MTGTELGRLEHCLNQKPDAARVEEAVHRLLSLPRLDALDHGHALPDRIPRSYSLTNLVEVGRALEQSKRHLANPVQSERMRRALRVWEDAGMEAAVEGTDTVRVQATFQEHDTLRVAGALFPQEEAAA